MSELLITGAGIGLSVSFGGLLKILQVILSKKYVNKILEKLGVEATKENRKKLRLRLALLRKWLKVIRYDLKETFQELSMKEDSIQKLNSLLTDIDSIIKKFRLELAEEQEEQPK